MEETQPWITCYLTDILLEYVKEKSKCVIATSHDPRIEGFADRVLRLEDGSLI